MKAELRWKIVATNPDNPEGPKHKVEFRFLCSNFAALVAIHPERTMVVMNEADLAELRGLSRNWESGPLFNHLWEVMVPIATSSAIPARPQRSLRAVNPVLVRINR